MLLFPIRAVDIRGDRAIIRDQDARHLTQSLRIKPGQALHVVDEHFKMYHAQVMGTGPRVEVRLLEEIPAPPPPYPVHLHVGLLKKDKMEWITQKAVELNIASVQFVETARSIRKELSPKHWQRLQKIAGEAQKQCGRIVPLDMTPPGKVDNLWGSIEGLHLFCMTEGNPRGNERGERPTLKDALAGGDTGQPIHIWIGPEGGWGQEEIAQAQAHEFRSVELAPLVLRAETAALHAVSAVLTLSPII